MKIKKGGFEVEKLFSNTEGVIYLLKKVMSTKVEGEEEPAADSFFPISGYFSQLLCLVCGSSAKYVRLSEKGRKQMPDLSEEKIVKYLIKNGVGKLVCQEHKHYDFNGNNVAK